MWIMYTAFAAVGLLAGFLIKKKVLSSQHEETKTGLAAEKENAAARIAEKEAKRASKRASARPSTSDTNRHLGSGETLADDVPPMPESRPKDLEMGDPEKTVR
jgi:hypothetical protein